jgi:hypothetical protein
MPLAAAVLRGLSEKDRHPHDAGRLRLLSDVLHSLTIVSPVRSGDPIVGIPPIYASWNLAMRMTPSIMAALTL